MMKCYTRPNCATTPRNGREYAFHLSQSFTQSLIASESKKQRHHRERILIDPDYCVTNLRNNLDRFRIELQEKIEKKAKKSRFCPPYETPHINAIKQWFFRFFFDFLRFFFTICPSA